MENENLQHPRSTESVETTVTPPPPRLPFGSRIWHPKIPSYPLERHTIDHIVKQFVEKIEKNMSHKLDSKFDPVYSTLKYGQDIRLVDELKSQFECKQLRIIDFNLLNVCKELRKEVEKLMVIYYKIYQNKERSAEEDKFLVLMKDYVKGRKIFLERNEEIREKINIIIYEAEKGWNCIKKCQSMGCKKF